MTILQPEPTTFPALDNPTRALVRLAATIACGSEAEMRRALSGAAAGETEPDWVEELILQSYLFAGFPRTLNAMREWRRVSGRRAPVDDEGADYGNVDDWRERGEETCALVYGPFYKQLRHNIRDLHPALDAWMIVDGYGKALGRDRLDIRRRELCVVATCAVARQDRQLHSHLHGALHAGASVAEVEDTLDAVADMLSPDDNRRYRQLWARVKGK
jgi:4-carboxymuconolactone decarboxylase